MLSAPAVRPGTGYAALLALEKTAGIRQTNAALAQKTWDGLAFRVREQWCLFALGEMREVLPMPSFSRIPNAEAWMTGLANVRGVIVPLIDLAALLGQPRTMLGATTRVMVSSGNNPLGFIVDEVSGLRRFIATEQRHDFMHHDPHFTAAWANYTLGGFERDNLHYLALSLAKIIAAPGFAVAEW